MTRKGGQSRHTFTPHATRPHESAVCGRVRDAHPQSERDRARARANDTDLQATTWSMY